jgi:hypothetical protein
MKKVQDKYKKCQKLYSDLSGDMYLKVMAVEDNYVMARFKGCTPFCLPASIFFCKYASYSYTEIPTHDQP